MYLSCGWRYNVGAGPGKLPRAKKSGAALSDLVPSIISRIKPLPPLRLHRGFRPNWEFYAVTRGRVNIVPEAAAGVPTRFFEHSMWVSPPNSCHSWWVPPGSMCEVVVFHFSNVPEALERSLGESRSARVGFEPGEVLELEYLVRRLISDYQHPTELSPLVFDAALLELSAFFLKRLGAPAKDVSVFDPRAHKVATALQWYRGHMELGPGIGDVAEAVGISAGHFRKLCYAVHGKPARSVLDEIAMESAKQLMLEPEHSLKEIALACGFTGYSQFYRAFRRYTGLTPMDWIRGKTYLPDSALGAAPDDLEPAGGAG
jgi:AraC-like DNA-binding protein